MASKFLCRCGETIRTNLYEGHGLRLLVPEELTDIPDLVSDEQAQAYISELVESAHVMAECPNCKTLAVIDKNCRITFYVPLP